MAAAFALHSALPYSRKVSDLAAPPHQLEFSTWLAIPWSPLPLLNPSAMLIWSSRAGYRNEVGYEDTHHKLLNQMPNIIQENLQVLIINKGLVVFFLSGHKEGSDTYRN